jgi:hypothetical protein
MTSNSAPAFPPGHSAEVISFPRSYTLTSQNPEDILANLLEMKVVSVEEVMSFVVPTFFETLLMAGFTADDDRLNTLLVGVTRAIMYRHYNLRHPLSDFIIRHADELDELLSNQSAMSEMFGDPNITPEDPTHLLITGPETTED